MMVTVPKKKRRRGSREIAMPNQIFTVSFAATVHASGAHFVVPVHVRKAFDWHDLDRVGLVIFSENGDCQFCGDDQTLRSGPEVYDRIEMKGLKPKARIHVVAFRPRPKKR
jgi:hypothetical protein